MLAKPDPCLGPQILAGATFGQGQYHPGSGLAAAITNTTNSALAPETRFAISNALAVHTSSLATGTVPFQTANDNLLSDWLNVIGVNLADLNVPQTLINWFAPENSLRVKNDLLFQGMRCNAWYREVLRNGC